MRVHDPVKADRIAEIAKDVLALVDEKCATREDAYSVLSIATSLIEGSPIDESSKSSAPPSPSPSS
jgi:hypothetical protein